MHTSSSQSSLVFLTTVEGTETPVECLDSAGSVLTATSAHGVLDLLSTETECILVDASEGSDSVVDSVRKLSEQTTVPLVAFVGTDQPATIDRLFEAGVTDIIQSPPSETTPAVLHGRLKTVLAANSWQTDSSTNPGVDERRKHVDDQRLEERDELLRYLSENLTAAFWVAQPSGEIEFASTASADILGQRPTHIFDTESPLFERIHPDDRERIQETRQQNRITPDAYDEEFRLLGADGAVRWVREQWFAVYEQESLTRIVGIMQDVTRHKERENELERQREFVQQTHEVAAVGGWELLFEDDTLRWTDEVYSLLNLPQSYEPTLEKTMERYHPVDKKRAQKGYRAVQSGEPMEDMEIRIRTGDGELRWFQLSGELIVENGDRVGIRGVFKDIHERKQREQALQNERDLVERILETSPVGIVVHNADGEIIRANEQASEILDIDHEILLNADPHPPEVTLFTASGEASHRSELPFNRIERTGEPVYDWEVCVRHPSGEEIILNADGVPLFDDDELSRVVIAFDDITERVNREERLKAQRNELAQLDRLNHIIREVDKALLESTSREEIEAAVCDNLSSSGWYQHVIAFRKTTDDELILGERSSSVTPLLENALPIKGATAETCPAYGALATGHTQVIQNLQSPDAAIPQGFDSLAAEMNLGSIAAIPISYGERTYGVITVYSENVSAFSEREIDVLDELGEVVGYAISAVESREREQTLTALYEATQDLLAAESRWAVSRVVVSTAAEVLRPGGIGIFLFDDDENVLRTAAATGALHEFYGDQTTFGPGYPDSLVWQSYIDGETKLFADVHNSEQLAYPETEAKQTLMVPLGDHGVFVVTDTEYGHFDEEMQRLIGLLAATTEAAFDRVEGQADIEQRDAELAQRSERIDRFEEMFSLIGDTDRLLRRAGTRKEIERGVCERFVESAQYRFAWVGQIDPESGILEPKAWDGVNDGYLDTLTFDTRSEEPAARTANSGEPTVIKNVTDHLRKEPWASEALDRGYQSMLAVPLTYGEATYGVLTVYADKPDAFDDIVEPVITTLGETIAHSINAIETRRGILADTVVELELEIEQTDTFLNAVAEVAEEAVSYREITPDTDGRSQVLFAVSASVVDEILALESEFVAVESLTYLENREKHLFRVAIAEPTVADTLVECGAIPKSVTTTATGCQATVHLPRERDVREFLDRVRDRYPQTGLRSQQTVDSHQSADSLKGTLANELTDRQREVLVTAFESGYFESPRATTGVELAELLDISQPTMTHHLREAQRRLFTSLFDDN